MDGWGFPFLNRIRVSIPWQTSDRGKDRDRCIDNFLTTLWERLGGRSIWCVITLYLCLTGPVRTDPEKANWLHGSRFTIRIIIDKIDPEHGESVKPCQPVMSPCRDDRTRSMEASACEFIYDVPGMSYRRRSCSQSRLFPEAIGRSLRKPTYPRENPRTIQRGRC